MIHASLRFADTSEAQHLWRTDTAICGRSENQKDKNGELTTWAAPIEGTTARGGRAQPLSGYWDVSKPKNESVGYSYLFPIVNNDWKGRFWPQSVGLGNPLDSHRYSNSIPPGTGSPRARTN